MKKAICRENYWKRGLHQPEEETLIGFLPEYMWKLTSYFVGPSDAGKYLVIKKDGSVRQMYFTGTRSPKDKAQELFHMVAEEGYDQDSYIDDIEMTDTDVLNIYRDPWGIWYEIREWYEYEDRHTDVHVYTKDSNEYPVYFLDLNLYEKIELNENLEITGTDGNRYYKLNAKNEFEEWEEETK